MSGYWQQQSRGRDFNSIIQTCSGNVQRITNNTAQIRTLLNQLGTSQDSSKLQQNLQQIQHSTNVLAKETNTYLKDLASLPTPLSPAEQRQQKLQKDRLMNEFSAALNHFQNIQRQVSEKEKETVARARAGSRLSGDEKQKEEQLVSFDKQNIKTICRVIKNYNGVLVNINAYICLYYFLSNEDWNQLQSQEEEFAVTEEDLELIKERESAIQKLEADILDVNQIFKDLAVMIHDQGEMIDSIEANVESAEVHVERANEQLQRAAYYQKKSRKKICILVLSLAIAVVILVIIICVSLKS
ncbi:hypothetical protein GDO86_003436 [Hymenochirus boettgeri]|uniref:Syntaxin-12 n=1 Tax=Hymenochirus boettgeri TaxID=247094 RepID=A0A8T2K9I1_9PIPI|nr:hypothetical protein GDO86_003436 [Hymenochirus boettgeri]